ncbi:MAG TPA: hypothetical protein VJ326_08015 [Thermoplasmata archaeon]|nr:hypothetical protein [Thermoplasmata archaeon]
MSSTALLVTQIGLLAAGLASLALSLHVRDLIRAVAAFAAGSAFVAAAFFVLAAPFAAALELTVGGGLMAVLFLVAITLTGGREDGP